MVMKKWFLPFLLLLFAYYVSAQQEVIAWSFSSKKISGNLYEIQLTATLKRGWHIYSRNPGDGPIPTSITFIKSPVIELKGDVKEIGSIKAEQSDIFNSEISYYENQLTLTQKVFVKGKIKTSIKGRVEFMVCNHTQCLPPRTVAFSISLV